MRHAEAQGHTHPGKPALLEKQLGLWDVYALATGATPVAHGAALPHMRSHLLDRSYVALARVSDGIRFGDAPEERPGEAEPIRAVFFLVSPKDDPGRHLRILAQIARRVDHGSFMPEWLAADTDEQLKEALIRDERIMVMTLESGKRGAELIGLRLRELTLPGGTLIAMILRGGELVIPKGETTLLDGDRLTVIGRPGGISALREHHGLTLH